MENEVKYNARMPAEVRDAIAEIAEMNGRSMNTEILFALQEYIAKHKMDPTESPVSFEKMLGKMDAMLLLLEKIASK